MEYYESGIVKIEYAYVDGLMNGQYKYYHENSQLWTERKYMKGLLWEVLSNYDAGGKGLESGTLKNGNGSVIVYNDKGVQINSITYQNGKYLRNTKTK